MAAAGNTQENKKIVNIVYDEDDEDCPVCLDSFEDIKCSIVTCGCGYKVCLNCTKKVLLTTAKDPHCMHCKRAWNRSFQYDQLTPSFINNKYKKIRKELLFEKEKAMMPDTIPMVENYMKVKEFEAYLNELKEQEEVARIAYNQVLQKRIQLEANIKAIKNFQCVSDVKEKTERRKFIKKCPNNDCRGFLSTSWKCELCNIYVCKDCFEIKGYSKNEQHTCDPNNVKSAQAIKNETKPCPKCSTAIYKISGCDQMWCTQCKIAFSWKSGKIVTGTVHNPHYYEYLNSNTDTLGLRNPGEIVCGGLVTYYTIGRKLSSVSEIARQNKNNNDVQKIKLVLSLHRGLTHLLYTIIQPLREKVNNNADNVDLRVKYLSKEIDEKHFKKIVAQRDNIREKNISILHVLELFNTIGTEQLNNLSESLNKFKLTDPIHLTTINGILNEMDNITNYCNKELQNISKNYKMKVHQFNDMYIISHNKKQFK